MAHDPTTPTGRALAAVDLEAAELRIRLEVAQSIIRDTLWMAQRYATGRRSYAAGMYNGAARLALAHKFVTVDRDGTAWALDGTKQADYAGLSEEENAEALKNFDAIAVAEKTRDLAIKEMAAWAWKCGEAEQRMKAAREALKPFGTVGRIIDGPFGPALFAEDDMAFQSGCAWTEDGHAKKLTWGDFRRAHEAIAEIDAITNPKEARK